MSGTVEGGVEMVKEIGVYYLTTVRYSIYNSTTYWSIHTLSLRPRSQLIRCGICGVWDLGSGIWDLGSDGASMVKTESL